MLGLDGGEEESCAHAVDVVAVVAGEFTGWQSLSGTDVVPRFIERVKNHVESGLIPHGVSVF